MIFIGTPTLWIIYFNDTVLTSFMGKSDDDGR